MEPFITSKTIKKDGLERWSMDRVPQKNGREKIPPRFYKLASSPGLVSHGSQTKPHPGNEIR